MDIGSSFCVCSMGKCSFYSVSRVFSAFLSFILVCVRRLLVRSYEVIKQTHVVPAHFQKTFLAVTSEILGRDYTNSCFTSSLCYYATIVVNPRKILGGDYTNSCFIFFLCMNTKGTDGLKASLGLSVVLCVNRKGTDGLKALLGMSIILRWLFY